MINFLDYINWRSYRINLTYPVYLDTCIHKKIDYSCCDKIRNMITVNSPGIYAYIFDYE